MKATDYKLGFQMHIPHGSGDGEWQIIDLNSDNGDVVAIVDPQMIMPDLDADPGKLAALFAAAPELAQFVQMIARFKQPPRMDKITDDQMESELAAMHVLIRKARTLAKKIS